MLRFTLRQLAIAICGLSIVAGNGAAQEPRPISRTEGGANDALRQIYRQDVGTGYSGQSLNQLALRNAMARVPNVGQQTADGPRGSGGLVGGGPIGLSSKPFTGYSADPTTSPYLNLFREDFDGNSDFNYHTLVRPQLQQQQFQRQVQQQNLVIGQRIQELSAQPDFKPGGSEQQFPTGHQTVFMYHGRYYPALNAPRRRGR